MSISEQQRQQVMAQAQGALRLQIAYVGVANHLFPALTRLGEANVSELAAEAGRDPGYVERWCDAALAFGLVEEVGDGRFVATDLGAAFDPAQPGSLMPFAVQTMLSAHMAESAASRMESGERPGEAVLGERPGLLPWFGPMLEATFAPLFEGEILPQLDIYREAETAGGVAVDLGCGNGWYLRTLARALPRLRGVGVDGFAENIDQATLLAAADGVADRLTFTAGDLHDLELPEPPAVIAMNRALHHVWSERDRLLPRLAERLAPGGAVVVWEPAWPDRRSALLDPARRPMAFQNLAEHVQGNHFLRPAEVAAAFEAVGLTPEVHLFAGDKEAVIVARKGAFFAARKKNGG